MESEDTVPPLLELDENPLTDESIFRETPPVFFCERKRRSTEMSMDEEQRQQLGELQTQNDDFQLQHEILQHEMREKVLDSKELKEESAFAQSPVNKARKLDSGASQSEDRRGKSLDGWESDGTVKPMRALIQNLELEKLYMEKEPDSLKAQSAIQADSADSDLKALQVELKQSKVDAANAKVNLSVALQQIIDLQKELKESRQDAASAKVTPSHALQQTTDLQQEQQLGLDQQAALAAPFNELTIEVETAKSGPQALFMAAVDSTNALKATLMSPQMTLPFLFLRQREIRQQALRMISKAHKEKIGERIAELEQELELVSHEIVSLILQLSEGEKDALIETSKQAQVDMDRLRGKKRQELNEAQIEMELASSESHLAKEQVFGVQALLIEKTEEQQALQYKLENLQREATTCSRTPDESVRAVQAQLPQKCTELEFTRREYGELVAGNEVLNKEKCEISAVCYRSEEERNRLCRELDGQGHELAEALRRFESGRAQRLEDEKQSMSELQLALSKKNVELEALKFKIANFTAEKVESMESIKLEMEDAKVTWDRALQDLLSEKTAELEQVQQENSSLVRRVAAVEHSLTAECAQRIEEVQAIIAQKTAEFDHIEEQEKNWLVERMTAAEQSQREELDRNLQELVTAVSSLQTVNSEIHEQLKRSELRLNESIGEKEKASKENEVLLDGTKQLQERISCLEHEDEQHLVELRQLEKKLASANSVIEDVGKQLNDVHALLTENQKEQLALQLTLEEVEKCKVGLQERLSTKEIDLTSTAGALLEIKSKFEEDTFEDRIREFECDSLSVERNRGIASSSSPKFIYFSDFGNDEEISRNAQSLATPSVEQTPNLDTTFQDNVLNLEETPNLDIAFEDNGPNVEQFINPHQEESICFRKVLNNSYTTKILRMQSAVLWMYVPVWFIKKHGDTFGESAVLRIKSSPKEWTVLLSFSPRTSPIVQFYGDGWKKFICDNHLQRGDTLDFLLSTKSKFLVHVVRKDKTQR